MENWLKKRVLLSPNKIAIQAGNTKLTFKEVSDRVAVLAARLANKSRKGMRVALLTNNTIDGYLMILSLQQLGCEIVFLNKRLSHEELQYQLEDAAVSLLIYDESLLHEEFVGIESLTFNQIESLEESRDFQLVSEFNDDEVTTIMYTSGTTGKPKGVQQSFKNHFYSAISSALNLGLTDKDNWLCAVPIFHISGLSIIMRGLIYGMTVTLMDKFDAEKVTFLLKESSVSTMSVVPTMLQQLLEIFPQEGYNSNFRCFLLGGGPIDKVTLEQCQQRNIPVIQSYGMTETASQVIALNFEDAGNKIGSVGKPLFSVELKLAHDGEVLLKAPNITPGYLNNPEKNQEVFENGWFKAGDIGYLDEDGFLYLKGRKGDMIISGGENIFPHEVEESYLKLTGVKDIVVAGITDKKWGQVPVAFVILERKLSQQELISYGREHLAHYKVPVRFYQVMSYPQTASGKVKRRELIQIKEYQKNLIK